MRNTDICDDRRVRLCGGGHSRDLAEMVHAHFNDGGLCFRRDAEQRFGHTDLVIEVSLGFERIIFPREHGMCHFFCGRFSDAACNGDQLYILAGVPIKPRNIQKRLPGVFDQHVRHIRPGLFLANDRFCAVLHGSFAEVVPVKPLAAYRDIQRACFRFAAVDDNARKPHVLTVQPAACRLFDLPQRQFHFISSLSGCPRRSRAHHSGSFRF